MRLSKLCIILCIACTCILAPCAFSAARAGTSCDSKAVPNPGPVESPPQVSLLIYENIGGRIVPKVYTGADIVSGQPIRVEGYVTGIILLGSSGTVAFIDNRPMDSARRRHDGSYDFSYFERIGGNTFDSSLHDYIQAGGFEPQACYTCIDTIPGNAVIKSGKFTIAIKNGSDIYEQVVEQSGCYELKKAAASGNYGDLSCRYFGTAPQQFRSRAAEFNERLASIRAGVRAVETALNLKLVADINIIDYPHVYNALTKYGSGEMWIYLNTFWSEPVAELRRIAEHETLHIVTDRYQLPKNAAIRNVFCDLKGYDLLSLERFAIVTTGCLPSNPSNSLIGQETSLNPLFAFINEKNFIKGAKGGHSQDDLDEFCTSYLHTLLYYGQLEANLNLPVIFPNGTSSRLSPTDRVTMIREYRRILHTVSEAAEKSMAGPALSNYLASFRGRTLALQQRVVERSVALN